MDTRLFNSPFILFSILLLVLFSIPVDTFSAELIKSSKLIRPDWVLETPDDGENLFFVGNVPEALKLKQGKIEAAEDAAEKILDTLGIRRTSSDYESRKSKLLTEITTGIASGGKIDVPGLKMLDGYYEEWLEDDGNVHYNVYILLRYVMDAFEEQLRTLEAEYKVRFQEANDFYASGTANEQKNSIVSALKDYTLAFNTIAGISDIPGKPKLLNNVVATIENIVVNIQFLPYENAEEQSVIMGIKTPLMLKAVYKTEKTELILTGLPVSFSFIEGTGIIEKGIVQTDMAGIARCHIQEVASDRLILRALLKQVSISPSKLTNLLFEISSGEESALFEKGYVLGFESVDLEDEIGFTRDGELIASLKIKITSPGSSSDIFFELGEIKESKKTEKIKLRLPLPDETKLRNDTGQVSFTPEDLTEKDFWDTDLSLFRVTTTVLRHKTKQYYSAFTPPFVGFEEISFKISIALK